MYYDAYLIHTCQPDFLGQPTISQFNGDKKIEGDYLGKGFPAGGAARENVPSPDRNKCNDDVNKGLLSGRVNDIALGALDDGQDFALLLGRHLEAGHAVPEDLDQLLPFGFVDVQMPMGLLQ